MTVNIIHSVIKMDNVDMKTLRVSDETHKELTKLGSYGDSMDDIVKKLIESYRKK